MSAALYNQVITITEEYLGPAADRFVKRQVSFHLNKKTNELDVKDIPELAEWVKVSLALLTEDKKMVDSCEQKIMALSSAGHR